jgi:hypothetical protein
MSAGLQNITIRHNNPQNHRKRTWDHKTLNMDTTAPMSSKMSYGAQKMKMDPSVPGPSKMSGERKMRKSDATTSLTLKMTLRSQNSKNACNIPGTTENELWSIKHEI